jgi:hypothetical protein
MPHRASAFFLVWSFRAKPLAWIGLDKQRPATVIPTLMDVTTPRAVVCKAPVHHLDQAAKAIPRPYLSVFAHLQCSPYAFDILADDLVTQSLNSGPYAVRIIIPTSRDADVLNVISNGNPRVGEFLRVFLKRNFNLLFEELLIGNPRFGHFYKPSKINRL